MGLLDRMKQAMADAQAMSEQAAGTDPYLADKSLRGPAGRYVYGLHLSTAEREAERRPSPGSPEEEYRLRAEARAPYLAAERTPVRLTRFVTREKHQVEDVAAHLAATGLAARPDLVFGLYRVPDHLGSGLDRHRVVEWDVVHADLGNATVPAAPPPVAAWFDAGERWVARRRHEPMVYDEEVALEYLRLAGIGPEQTLGLSRLLAIHHVASGDETGDMTASYVTGVHAWHAASFAAAGERAFEQWRSSGPALLEPGGEAHLDVFNWAGIRKAVAPVSGQPPLVPSPFPYLPSRPQELIVSYLDIVGVHPADCYAAAVTEDVPRDLNTTGRRAGFSITSNVGATLPCADGTPRPRLHGGARIVVAYRDRPAYAQGRERFAAYQRAVLESQLERGAERRPLEYDDLLDHLPRGLRGFAKAGAAVGRFATAETDTVVDRLPPFRYCWPPIDHR